MTQFQWQPLVCNYLQHNILEKQLFTCYNNIGINNSSVNQWILITGTNKFTWYLVELL